MAEVVFRELFRVLRVAAILRPDRAGVEDEREVDHLGQLDGLAEIHKLLHTEFLGLAELAVQHVLMALGHFHGHGFGVLYAARVMVTVAFWPTFGASISTQSPVLMAVIGSWSRPSTAGISPAMQPLMSMSWTFWQMMPAGP